jgi:hypothetical protein
MHDVVSGMHAGLTTPSSNFCVGPCQHYVIFITERVENYTEQHTEPCHKEMANRQAWASKR